MAHVVWVLDWVGLEPARARYEPVSAIQGMRSSSVLELGRPLVETHEWSLRLVMQEHWLVECSQR